MDPDATDRASLLDSYRGLVADAHELAHVTRRISDREAREVGATASQWHVLSVLSGGPRTVPSIAGRLGLSRQAVQRTCDELVATGAAVVRTNPRSLRSPLVEATPSGLALQETLYDTSAVARLAAMRRAGLRPRELAAARRTVRALLDSLDPGADRSG